MCETMQSSHRLRPAMALVRALLAPTASGDVAGARLCPSPALFHENPENTNWKKKVFCPFFCPSNALEVTVESGGNFEDYIRFLSCHLFGPVNHGQKWKG